MDLERWAAPRRARLEAHLAGLFRDAWPAPFGEMSRYPITTGGKRVRPLLTFAAFESARGHAGGAGGADPGSAMAPAAAVELVHSYSLVHDDLPCMDDDDTRRGRPTAHVAFGEGNAVLIGDALLTEAFRLLAEAPGLSADARLALVAELARAAGYHGMIGGQAADVGVGGAIADADTLTRLHRGKTGALIRAAARMGAIAGGASAADLARLTTFAEALGLAFQVVDDLLDEDEDAGPDGPPSFPRLLGSGATRRLAEGLRADAMAALTEAERAGPLGALARFTVERSV